MANTPPNSSRSHPYGSRNPRVARRNTRLPRADPYPTHFTLSDLAARLHRHEQRLNTMDIELQETNENWRLTSLERIDQVSEDHENTVNNMDILDNRMGETIETMEVVHNQVISNRNEISVLQSRLNQCETRLRETEDALRMVSRLAESVDHLTALLPQLNLRQD